MCWKIHNGVKVYLLIYVDDILVMVSSARHVKEVKDELSRLYTIKDLGKAEYFLGIKLERTSHGGMKLMQSQYVTYILERYGMNASQQVSAPMVSNTELMKMTAPNEEESRKMLVVPYREAIEKLLYLSVRSRPDIAVSFGILAKHLQSPRPMHWEAVKRIFRHLKGTVNDGLVINGNDTTLPYS
jgi:Reverse transcriptase (RNA-dependent DNA polymerase)